MALSWRFGAFSDIGRTRKKNDDSGYAGPNLIVVADGMGGAPAGDLASAVAVQTLRRLDAPPPEDMLEALAGTFHRANDRLAEILDEDPAVAGMGTTVTAALFDGERVAIAHLGDSRGYLWRDDTLQRLTSDHTWVQSLIDEGRITEAESKVHSHRSLLLRVLDGQHDHDPDLALHDVRPGDRVLLCSDGLSGFVETDRIARALSVGTADSVARELTQLALEAGSTDNVTVVVADVVDSETVSTEPLLVGALIQPPRGGVRRLRNWASRDEGIAGKSLMADPNVDPEELRYAPREPRRFAGLRRLAVLLALAVAAAAAGLVGYQWSQQQYFVAAYGDRVAIYRGVQADLPGFALNSVYQLQALRLSELPSFRRSQVLEGLPADNLDAAQRLVATLAVFAQTCANQVASTSSGSSTTVSTSTSPSGPATDTPASAERTSTAPIRPTSPSDSARTTPDPTRSTHSPSEVKVANELRAAQSTSGPSAPEECAGATPPTSASVATVTAR